MPTRAVKDWFARLTKVVTVAAGRVTTALAPVPELTPIPVRVVSGRERRAAALEELRGRSGQ
jgi:hypothetical protein